MANGAQSFKKRYAESIGWQIRSLREDRNWTQRDLAALVGVTTGVVSRWESGESVPPFHRFLSLAEILGVGVEDLLQQKPAHETKDWLGSRLRVAHQALGPTARRAVTVVYEVVLALMEMDDETIEALIGAFEVVKGASLATRRTMGTRRAR
jgi:transcriptional regulator with XRE-family HTH domain